MLDGKVAIVTGGGRGIGQEVALAFARQRARVVVLDKGTEVSSSSGRDEAVAASVADAIVAAGGEALWSAADVTDASAVTAVFDRAVSEWGRVDIVVNAAGIIRDRMLWNVTPDEWDDTIAVHLRSCYATVGAFARYLRTLPKEPRDVSVVTFSSSAGVFGSVGSAAYGTAKAGVLGFTRIAALELRQLGVRANCIVPFAWTRMAGVLPTDTPADQERVANLRQLDPANVANVVVWLCASPDPALTGQVFGIRGNELMVFSQPRVETRIVLSRTDPEYLRDSLGHRLVPQLPPVRASTDVFTYEPFIG